MQLTLLRVNKLVDNLRVNKLVDNLRVNKLLSKGFNKTIVSYNNTN
jgi:hypothetical protein